MLCFRIRITASCPVPTVPVMMEGRGQEGGGQEGGGQEGEGQEGSQIHRTWVQLQHPRRSLIQPNPNVIQPNASKIQQHCNLVHHTNVIQLTSNVITPNPGLVLQTPSVIQPPQVHSNLISTFSQQTRKSSVILGMLEYK